MVAAKTPQHLRYASSYHADHHPAIVLILPATSQPPRHPALYTPRCYHTQQLLRPDQPVCHPMPRQSLAGIRHTRCLFGAVDRHGRGDLGQGRRSPVLAVVAVTLLPHKLIRQRGRAGQRPSRSAPFCRLSAPALRAQAEHNGSMSPRDVACIWTCAHLELSADHRTRTHLAK